MDEMMQGKALTAQCRRKSSGSSVPCCELCDLQQVPLCLSLSLLAWKTQHWTRSGFSTFRCPDTIHPEMKCRDDVTSPFENVFTK